MTTSITDPIASARLFKPELLLSAAMLLVVVVDATRARWRDGVNFAITALSLAAAAWLCLPMRTTSPLELWSGMVVLDPISVFFKILLIASSFLVLVMFRRSRELAGLVMSEFYALLLAVTVSTLLLATSNDLTMLYLALEMVSVTSYVMVAYMKGDKQSNEASLKYILFGAVSTGVMLYGLSLMYGLTGTTSIPAIRDALASGLLTDENRLALYVIALLIFAGFGFKTAAAPFHFWCPDVYQGAPTPVTAFLSVAPKAAGFAIMLRFFTAGLATPGEAPWDLIPTIDWQPVIMIVSVLTMTVGNVAALTQTNMKRLLAYSSIAHAGYILMGIVALSENGARSILIYLLCYVFMNLGAFLIVTLIHYYDGSFELRDYPGLYRRAPFLTLAMCVFLLSLMGIPPLIGFMGKLYVFSAIVQSAGAATDPVIATRLYAFAVIGAINAAIGAFYYARVMKTMVIEAGNEDKPALPIAALDTAWVMLLVAANVLPLVFWNTIEGWARSSLQLYAAR
jgi:NADH-quinone oxidoreductase subunit N